MRNWPACGQRAWSDRLSAARWDVKILPLGAAYWVALVAQQLPVE
jgi:hypothetical protein